MKLVNDVFEIANSFMEDSRYVRIDDDVIKLLSDRMLENGKSKFPFPDVPNVFTTIVYELVASSINYCYWYGRHDIRPGGASSSLMYQLMMNSFFDFDPNEKSYKKFSECLTRLGQNLAIHRFPLLEERIRHLDQLKSYAIDFCIKLENRYDVGFGNEDLTYFFTELVEKFPGFASDIFLKRASLFFIQLNRRLGWFEDELKQLHVPADYQIPKMLQYLECISYNDELLNIIRNNQLIPKNSIQECEIRAATILTIKKLCNLTGWNVADVDGFLFLKRDRVLSPFHLTITTDY